MAMKCQQFGLDEVWEGDPDGKSNIERLNQEFVDLNTMIRLLEEVTNAPPLNTEVMVEGGHRKARKVQKYLKYSQSLGMVEE